MQKFTIPMDTNSSAVTPQPEGIPPKKPMRLRSAAYPSYTIESCISFAQRINAAFSSASFTPQGSISETLGQSGGAFLMQLSSSVQYGLLEKSMGDGYKPSELLKKISKPMPGENAEDFKLECFNKPKLYKALIETYGNKQLPSQQGLGNILDRLHGIVGNAAITAAKIFYKNATDLKLLNEDNVLKMDNYIEFVEEKKESKDGGDTAIILQQPPAQDQPRALPAAGMKEIPILLKSKPEAKLILPDSFDDDDLRRVIKVLSAYLE